MNRIFINVFSLIIFFPLLIVAKFSRKKRDTIIWGIQPIITLKYWSDALNEIGISSQTIMFDYYRINKKSDFDIYFDELVPNFIKGNKIRKLLGIYFAQIYILKNASVVHYSFNGGPLGMSFLWKLENFLYRVAKIKTVIMGYGSDFYQYSLVKDPSLHKVLLDIDPFTGKNEKAISERVKYWMRRADIILVGVMAIDGSSRYDICSISLATIDEFKWRSKDNYNMANGIDGVVRILHAPNHRGFKGTEFLLEAIELLKKDGLNVELVLMENIQNDEICNIMNVVDILAEQFICTGYGLNGIEGMASGLPVLSNLENETYTRVFRRYSFLNDCPILSTSPESLYTNLKILVENPELRVSLGKSGRNYVELYHSKKAAQYMFSSIYSKILGGQTVDLMNLFHPLKSTYMKDSKRVSHGLFENKVTGIKYV